MGRANQRKVTSALDVLGSKVSGSQEDGATSGGWAALGASVAISPELSLFCSATALKVDALLEEGTDVALYTSRGRV